MTLSLIEHEHARHAEIGIFEVFKVSGFISCLVFDHVSHDCLLIPVSDAADALRRCPIQLGQFRFQHGLLLFDCGLLSGFIGCERPIQLSPFSGSLAAISGFAVTFGSIVGRPVTGGSRESLHVGYIEGCAVHRLELERTLRGDGHEHRKWPHRQVRTVKGRGSWRRRNKSTR